jgi:hypothetical protein
MQDLIRYISAGVVWAGLILLPATQTSADTTSREGSLRFAVDLDGRPIGEHTLTFEPQPDDNMNVAIDIDLNIKFGPFTVFTYSHKNRTQWRAGRLVSLQSETNDNGTPHQVRVISDSGGLRVIADDETAFSVTPSILPSTYWMASTVRQNQLINSQTGELLEVMVRRVGRELVNGPVGTIPATHYRMEGDLEIDLWYDDGGVLVGLAFVARGAQVAYRLVERSGHVPVRMAGTIMNTRN